MIAGDVCAVCEVGKLKKFEDEIEKGIKVEAFKCAKCGEIWYSEEIMKKVEAIQRAKAEMRHVVKIGNSLAAILPSNIVKKLNLKEKEKIYITESNGEIVIKPSLI